MGVDALSEALVAMRPHEGRVEVEAVFLKHYERVARVIARVIRDPGRAEELAVEVFLKWSRDRNPQRDNPQAWLYRSAVRTGLNELRRQTRQGLYEKLAARIQKPPRTPEELHAAREEQERVRLVLSRMEAHKAELLILRSEGLSYEELASALHLNPASIGTLLSRAQRAFRKEYLERYGNA